MGLLDLTGVTGLSGSAGDDVQKLRISYTGGATRSTQTVTLAYNPGQLSRSRSVNWHRAKVSQTQVAGDGSPAWSAPQQFLGLEPETLSLELFFDTYESGQDVTRATRRIAVLAEVDRELHSPPVCRLSWGIQSEIFTGVLTQLDQRFSMFLSDGTPVRATLQCTFTEYQTSATAKANEVHSADVVKVRTVRRGDTLASIAAQEYQDSARWRDIAVANAIASPRTLLPGTVLTIPKLAR
ncbi:LysM peptidoglycan-binding domain-containing protein [Dactylosporangium sp. NPDC051485]|uniref:CIS tube protein n=1 Tax=Dactylosporangium sp. NPDC051485 TaxID=3154846 RepID=UPI003413D2EB